MDKAKNDLLIALHDLIKLIENKDLVRNTENDGDFKAFLDQSIMITKIIKYAVDTYDKYKP